MDSVVEMPRQTTGYYADTAYRPDQIPEQPPQYEDHNQSALERFGTARLPWGHTELVVPIIIFAKAPPKLLRRHEKYGDPLEGTGHQGQMNHECFRYAPLAKRFQVLNLAEIISKFITLLFGPLLALTLVVMSFATSDRDYWQSVVDDWFFLLYS
ncbi:hypothetical protein EZI54_14245 [Marinobacter halodurans]|uniref:Uncharacterized protein n=1 Tax=Marinobacter halodurans TaxID=2528979 RepID=A0ABY1ZI27_9GAMM|nr:hypothetical protein [Marinobacter halodurans]TBW54270.1 hypothetical protein EZI54_14245 [Marinobacter halodurans]